MSLGPNVAAAAVTAGVPLAGRVASSGNKTPCSGNAMRICSCLFALRRTAASFLLRSTRSRCSAVRRGVEEEEEVGLTGMQLLPPNVETQWRCAPQMADLPAQDSPHWGVRCLAIC
eukprot:1898103-Pyramimonas_sp.AAC.1